MFSKDAKELADFIKYGTKVEVYGGELGPFGSKLRTLIPGDRGSDVMEVQQILKKYGYYSGYADGVYGTLLEKAVVKFQTDHNLKPDLEIGSKLYKLMGVIPFS
jgi:peptidoglycan hydrolase-like protein with peptidoglycan-binding domain